MLLGYAGAGLSRSSVGTHTASPSPPALPPAQGGYRIRADPRPAFFRLSRQPVFLCRGAPRPGGVPLLSFRTTFYGGWLADEAAAQPSILVPLLLSPQPSPRCRRRSTSSCCRRRRRPRACRTLRCRCSRGCSSKSTASTARRCVTQRARRRWGRWWRCRVGGEPVSPASVIRWQRVPNALARLAGAPDVRVVLPLPAGPHQPGHVRVPPGAHVLRWVVGWCPRGGGRGGERTPS